MNIPAKFSKRVNENLKKYQDIITNLKKRDANESDTVTVIADILQDIFGYDKYKEITSEYAIKGTYCDLAVVDKHKKIQLLLEAKSISITLNDSHIKQAVDYGSNAGVDWVILTNAENWFIYKIKFGKPIDKELIAEFNLLNINPKSEKDLGLLFVLSKDGQEISSIDDFYSAFQAKNKYIIGALLYNADVCSYIRKTLKRLFNDIKITDEEIFDVLANDIIKREVIDSEESKKARKEIERLLKKADKIKEKKKAQVSAIPETSNEQPESLPENEPIVSGE